MCGCGPGRRLFGEERRKVELRDDDFGEKGTIKGHFEIHFGVLIPETDITLKFCDHFDCIIAHFAAERRLDKDQISDELDKIFEESFRTKLPEGKHVTLGLWESWRDKFRSIVLGIVSRRSRRRRDEDSDSG